MFQSVCQTIRSCGPYSRCSCVDIDDRVSVDCQKANLSLLEICDICSDLHKPLLTLDISSNSLTGIPNHCFSGCVNLRSLISQNANLNSIEACEICQQFNDTLTSLDLSGNNLTTLPNGCFARCHNLEHLSMKDANLKNLEVHSLKNLFNLRELNLDSNHMATNCSLKSADVFTHLSSLSKLTLKKNVDTLSCNKNQYFLDNISPTAFRPLKELHVDGVEHIFFGENFNSFKNLTALDMSGVNSYCSIISLSNNTFSNVTYLRHLNISKGNITQIEAGTFERLKELTYLNLSYNQGLGFGWLSNVLYGLKTTKVKVFDFSKVYKTFGASTVLRICDFLYAKDTAIEELYLNSNRMVLLETNLMLFTPPNLTKVSAEDNKFSYGPYMFQFGCAKKVQTVYLNHQNTMHDLRFYNEEINIKEYQNTDRDHCIMPNRNDSEKDCPFIDDNETLRAGDLRLPETLTLLEVRSSVLRFKAQLETVKAFPFELPLNLEYIDFSNNVLYYLGPQFLELKHLKYLDLSNNFCTFIASEFFDSGPYIQTVKLSRNILGPLLAHDLQGLIFKPLKTVKQLDLSSNKIASLPDTIFQHLSNIENLNLSHNQLTEFKIANGNLKNLSKLDLHDNELPTLSVKMLEQLKADQKKNISIDLSNNTLEVSCENLEFLTWITDNPICFINRQYYIFRKNGESAIMTFEQLKESLPNITKNCVSYTALITVSSLLILTFVIVVIGGVLNRYKWRVKYLYYMAKFRGYTDLPEDGQNYDFDAFLSCADEEMGFIRDEVLPKLEDEFGLRCCVHARDFLAGVSIMENILDAIRRSRKTVVILTQNFLASKWCREEFNMARIAEIYSRHKCLMFILIYEDIDITTLSEEMLQYIDSETYAKYPADVTEVPYFWEGIRRALCGTDMTTGV